MTESVSLCTPVKVDCLWELESVTDAFGGFSLRKSVEAIAGP
jgi:hypothetical protein